MSSTLTIQKMFQWNYARGIRAELRGITLRPKYFFKCRECGIKGTKKHSPVCFKCFEQDNKCADKWINEIDRKV